MHIDPDTRRDDDHRIGPEVRVQSRRRGRSHHDFFARRHAARALRIGNAIALGLSRCLGLGGGTFVFGLGDRRSGFVDRRVRGRHEVLDVDDLDASGGTIGIETSGSAKVDGSVNAVALRQPATTDFLVRHLLGPDQTGYHGEGNKCEG
ncbi:hypothetical protein Rumeso_00994 [Rubellimicrobium mesophilum DSM 19309]|uniref:Uncharacterized protein n=1 Tax=Rubellimicrobium mesophilum DSM 19309 TaxID=442562 RepID=A0A017HSZ0_9RHOB|nr:hypothetical protein Rumeso_00994 [Rubellimicrobium mesophilum DSM 19309]